MSPRRLRVVLAVLGIVLLLAPAATADESLGISEVGGARFPDRAYVLTLPEGMYLDESRVEVRENGEPVSRLSVIPADIAGHGQFGVVLVVDASNSMRGSAIEDAVDAGRAFAARRNANQDVAIVTFNRDSRVVLQFTTSQEAIEASLAEAPPLASGTHIYDGVATALALIEKADIAAASVIVLSDGSDTGSTVAAAEVAARARAAHVRIFSVGLRSRSFKPQPLAALAAAAGGDYSEAASSADLERIFATLGDQLAREYLLRYRSEASPHTRVEVAVTVDGVEDFAATAYTTPALAEGSPGPFHRSFAERFLRSAGGMLFVAAASALLVGLAAAALLRPRARTLRRRMAQFVSIVAAEGADRGKQRDLFLQRAEKSMERTRWWARFKADLELADITLPATHVVAGTAVATLLAVGILFTVGGFLVALFGFAVPFVVRGLIRRKLDRKRQLFADQLPDNLQVLASALRAGHSMVGALSVVIDDCPEPARSEFGRVIADERLGVPLDEAFEVVAGRMASRDLEQVALVAALQRETGGNTAEVLDRVAETVRGRFELRRLVRTLTTQGRMSRWIVSLLPVFLLVLISILNPTYVSPLFSNSAGRVLLVLATIMVVAGSLVIKRIINIKV